MFVVTFCPFNIECNRGLRSMIFYDELVILECDSRHSLSRYFFRYPNLIRHHTMVKGWSGLQIKTVITTCFANSFDLLATPTLSHWVLHEPHYVLFNSSDDY